MKIFNSLSKTIETFAPLNNKSVGMYVCGITPYDTTHLGHAFTYVAFDVLNRYLKFLGYDVTYTQNVTDINDRDNDILERANKQNIPWQELSKFWTDKFLSDMKTLNWIMPDNYLKASEQIPSMIMLIEKLLINGPAYEVNGSVYLDINKVMDFGKLSRFSKEKMLGIAKDFEEDLKNKDKRNPLDITLWKASEKNQPKHIPIFDPKKLAKATPTTQDSLLALRAGRPGWHIECSAMAIKTLGPAIDIHGGGVDLIYPHHESEIAQSESATRQIPFAKYWIHTGIVNFQGKKMSKSFGNLVLVSDLLKMYSPNAIRFMLLSKHYRLNWEYKEEDLAKAQEKINEISKNQKSDRNNLEKFKTIMDNDLNTPKILEEIKNKEVLKILGFKI